MPSEFPGVDPYLESQGYWSDFHSRFMNAWCEAVAAVLPDHYEARIEETIRLVEVQPQPSTKRLEADVAVERRGDAGRATAVLDAPAGVTLLEAETIPLPEEPELIEERETSVRILRRPDRVLIAVLELLSPANKEEPGFSIYLKKRQAILHQHVHLVELDLLRGGKRPPLARPNRKGDYRAVIAHADQRPDTQVYTWGVRDRLPALPIPLSPPDAPVWVDLAAVFTTAFDRARFARSIDYSVAPTAVGAEDAVWADAVRQKSIGG